MESCFQHIDECNQEKTYKEKCLLESRECFSYHHYGFDYCFKKLTDCVGEIEEGHDDSDHHEEEEEEYCACSCQMDKCFNQKAQVNILYLREDEQ